jgi:hypothetical protein
MCVCVYIYIHIYVYAWECTLEYGLMLSSHQKLCCVSESDSFDLVTAVDACNTFGHEFARVCMHVCAYFA